MTGLLSLPRGASPADDGNAASPSIQNKTSTLELPPSPPNDSSKGCGKGCLQSLARLGGAATKAHCKKATDLTAMWWLLAQLLTGVLLTMKINEDLFERLPSGSKLSRGYNKESHT